MRILLLLSIVVPTSILCQETKSLKTTSWNYKIFYDEEMKEVREKNAFQYLLINIQANGLPKGKSQLFKTKGNILYWEGEYFFFNRQDAKKNKLQGLSTWYFVNGKISRQSNYKDGILHGLTTFYNEGGKIIYQGQYIDGKLEGGKMNQFEDDGTKSKVYFQDFESYYDGWAEEENKEGKAYVADGVLWINSKDKSGFSKLEYIDIDTDKDFSLETTFKFKYGMKFQNNSILIVYGYKDMQNYMGVYVTTKGLLKLTNRFEGIDMNRGNWLQVNLRKEWNTLKLLKVGDDVFVSINGNVVTSYKYSKFYGNYFGFHLFEKNHTIGVSSVRAKEFPYKSNSNNRIKEENDVAGRKTEKIQSENKIEWRPAGTGFYIANNGLVFTNYHVIEKANDIGITQVLDGRKYILRAKAVLTDPQNDLALLQIDDPKFISPGALPYIISEQVADVGESVFTMGYPLSDLLGDEIKITDGIISARSGLLGDTRHYQISAPITYGNSGGPLLDKEGNLLGINCSGIVNRNIAENTGYSIKSTLILNLLNSLSDPPKISHQNALKGKSLKDQIKILKNFVPMICIN